MGYTSGYIPLNYCFEIYWKDGEKLIDYKNTLKLIKKIDLKLILIVLAIFIYGLLILSSATHANQTGNYSRIFKQCFAFGIGLVLALFIIMIDYNTMGKYYKELYAVSIALLALVLIFGDNRGGAKSTFNLVILDLQVIEVVKITFILSFAKIVENNKGRLNTLKDIFDVVIYAVPVIGHIIIQPDLGGALIFCCIVFGMIFSAGIDKKILIKAGVIILVLIPIMYMVMSDYQKNRILGFMNPEDTSIEGNYQLMQSMIAIGSGGLTGKGLYNGTQNQEDFLPIQDSDFIFAVVVEELGVIGGSLLVGLYVLFLLRMIKIAMESKDIYGSFIVIGVVSMFSYQIIQNIGMTMALIPVTGVTLSFISYGGSAVMTSLAIIGLVLNVGMRRKKINF